MEDLNFYDQDFYNQYIHDQYIKYEPYIQRAKQTLKEFFRKRKTPFYFRQLQVYFESESYHITTAQAIYELVDEGLLKTIPYQVGANKVVFVVSTKVAQNEKTQRTLESHMRTIAKVVAKYDSSEVSKDLGDHFESLVTQELRANQLHIDSIHTRSYKGKEWTATNHTLDLIADYEDGPAFGIEAKNQLASIERMELYVKLAMCKYLGLKPIFIVRYMPWSFVPYVTAEGGFVLTLGDQIYPLGYRKLCQEIQDKLSLSESQVSKRLKDLAPKMRTRWPIQVSTFLPEDACQRLSYWLKTGRLPLPKSSIN